MFDGFGLSKHAVYRRYKRETDSDNRYEAVILFFMASCFWICRCSLGHDAGLWRIFHQTEGVKIRATL
jgi:hypothetical protein